MMQREDARNQGAFAYGQPLVCVLLLAVLTVLAYLPAIRADYVWDDADYITENPCIVGPLGLREIWTSSHASMCPVVLTTFWAEHRLWGIDPAPYHVVNILMHAAAAVVLWRVLLRLKSPGAWLGAALWALHPVQAESVAWISEMKNTESGLFFLLSVLFFCRSRQAQSGHVRNGHPKLHYSLTLVFGALALFSKSSTVILPLVLGLCAWWMDRSWNLRRNLLQLAPLLILSALAMMLTLWTQQLEADAGEGSGLSAFQRMCLAGIAIWFYLGKLAWPHPLMTIYPHWDIRPAGVFACLPAIAVVAVFIILWKYRNERGRALWLGFAFFVLALLPVLGLVDHNLIGLSFVFDHFQYLASMGPLALAGAGIGAALNACEKQHFWAKPIVCSVILAVLGRLTYSQCAIYENEETLWTAALSQNPSSWAAHNNLGLFLAKKGRVDGALEHFEKALQVRPGYAEAHNNLGMALRQKGQTEAALSHFQSAVEINPRNAEAHNNLGIALRQQGRTDEAMSHFQKALEIQPRYAEAHFQLGNQLQRSGRIDEAIRHFQMALDIKADYAEAHNNLGLALQAEGELDQAVAHYQKALDIKPGYAEAHNNLGTALGQKGLTEEAMKHFQKAIEINTDFAEARTNLRIALKKMGGLAEARGPSQTPPGAKSDSAEAHYNRGNEFQEKGQLDDAMAEYKDAINLKPDYAEAHNNLGIVLAQKADLQGAMGHYQKAVDLKPNFSGAQYNLGLALQKNGRPKEAIEHFQKAVEFKPDYAAALRSLAYLLASSEEASLRDGPRAVELAQRASKLTGGTNPMVLGTLAAAQAESGDFPTAVATVQQAIEIAEKQNLASLAAVLHEHLKLYERGEALRGGQ